MNISLLLMLVLGAVILVYWKYILLGICEIYFWWSESRAAYWFYRLKLIWICGNIRISTHLHLARTRFSFLWYKVRMRWYLVRLRNGLGVGQCPIWRRMVAEPDSRKDGGEDSPDGLE